MPIERLDKVKIQIQESPEDPESGKYPETKLVYDNERISLMLEEANAIMEQNLEVLYERGLTLEELEQKTQELLESSKEYLAVTTALKESRIGKSNVYWIFILHLISSVLSLVTNTNETTLAVKTTTIARTLFSFVVFFASLFERTKIKTNAIFGTLYIISTWLIAIVGLITGIVKVVRLSKHTAITNTNYYHLGLQVLAVIFITVFGVKGYITSGGLTGQVSKIVFGYGINSWYLSGISLISLLICGIKVYELFFKKTEPEPEPEPEPRPDPSPEPPQHQDNLDEQQPEILKIN